MSDGAPEKDVLSCQQMTEIITEFLEGSMSDDDRLRFQKHVGLCRHCRAYLKQMRDTVETLGKMPDEQIPAEVMSSMLSLFQKWKSD